MVYRCFDELLFFFNGTATTEIYTPSLHDALPIYIFRRALELFGPNPTVPHHRQQVLASKHAARWRVNPQVDRKSTRLNSSHANISYAVFCLKKNHNNIAINHSYNTRTQARMISAE